MFALKYIGFLLTWKYDARNRELKILLHFKFFFPIRWLQWDVYKSYCL